MGDPKSEKSLKSTYWRDEVWLQRYPLNSETVLRDYFCLSTFYDLQCNNETLKTLNLTATDIHTLAPGVEYAVVTAQEPDFFVIKKQHRNENQDTTPLAYYYVLNGTVYQAPDLFSAIFSKVKRCQFLIDKSFTSFSKALDPLLAESKEKTDDLKRKFFSRSGWGKMKTGADVASAILSGYPPVPIPFIPAPTEDPTAIKEEAFDSQVAKKHKSEDE